MSWSPKELATRAAVGGILIALAATILWLGGLAFWLVTVVVGVLMIGEWAVLSGERLPGKRLAQYALSIPLAILCPWAAGPGFFALGLIVAAAFFLVIVKRNPQLGGGALYVGLPVLALLALREQENGLVLAVWTMALVWACDIGAYFAGRTFGGPLLAPKVSPAKTWSGLAGGVLLAGLFGVLMTYFGLPSYLAAATPFLAVVAQLGDLFESHIKRVAGVKDSDNILPGHGGMMDRLDGLVPVAPTAALLVMVPQWLT
ncbi:phosphatidate cytidylyltransferase [Stakelama tenebrarum]|uniref:Phosphatidate cytidylyltransferase n=1 Tax=Stakelama tenebrarum TaxID=2711215 RepID=A0A6G6Y5S2_9SPHN|nr:phosphatidate cytidylyltransferase [Sphingosinithalassobacter tenebrarum]QIG80282.1 phosphatidate cytidylyltransferase [Sphingosinithalassobacter tenebrarum]